MIIYRLKKLNDRFKELNDLLDDAEGINKNSLTCFLNFCELIKDDVLDDFAISLTSDMEIYANYRTEEKKHSIRAKGDGTIKYFCNDR